MSSTRLPRVRRDLPYALGLISLALASCVTDREPEGRAVAPLSVAAGPCAGLCGGFNAQADCYCDAVCVLAGDCCPGAVELCEGSWDEPPPPPEPPPPLPGSCEGSCNGISPDGCLCMAFCQEFDEGCCEDAVALCESEWEMPPPPEPPGEPSCEGVCGGAGYGCFCDAVCVQFGDCCPDAVELCSGSWEEPPPPPPPPGEEGTCVGACGGAAIGCWCDAACQDFGDCCPDAGDVCEEVGDPPAPPTEGSCENACGGSGGGCWCDAVCEDYGDCCPDAAALCASDW